MSSPLRRRWSTLRARPQRRRNGPAVLDEADVAGVARPRPRVRSPGSGRRALGVWGGAISGPPTSLNENRLGAFADRVGERGGPPRVHIEVDAELLERRDALGGAFVRHHVEETHRGGADVDECRAHADRVARTERAAEFELELERREAAALGSHVARRDPQERRRVTVGRREAVDVVQGRDLAEDVHFAGLHRVARAVAEALESAGPRAALARRTVPLDAPALGGPPLRRRQRPGGAALRVHVMHALLDRRADVARLGIVELVAQHEGVRLDGEDAARDVHDVADAELVEIAYVAVGGHAEAPSAPGVLGSDPERVE